MNDPCEGIKDLLVTAGIGIFAATSGWGIFIGQEPSTSDTTITIYPTGGNAPSPKFLLNYPSVQVRVRGAAGGYLDARAKIQAISDALLGLPSQTLNSDRWVAINQVGDITSLGPDQNNRPRLVLNFALIIEPNTGTYRQSL